MTDALSFKDKKVIVLDLDGTIVDLPVDWAYLKNLLSERFSKIHNQESCSFESISECLDALIEKGEMSELEKNFEIIHEHELKEVKNSQIIKETVFFIKNVEDFGVHIDTKFAICSLNTQDCIKEALEIAGVLDKFDFIVGREDVTRWKPDPEGLIKIKDHYQVDKKEIVYFGDLPKDIQTGKNAGIDAYYITEIIYAVRNRQ